VAEKLAEVIAKWLLEQKNTVALTPRKLRKLARMYGVNPHGRETRKLMDAVLNLLNTSGEKRVEVRVKRGIGVRVVFVMPPSVDSPFLSEEE